MNPNYRERAIDLYRQLDLAFNKAMRSRKPMAIRRAVMLAFARDRAMALYLRHTP